jgi:hypothetical protein
MAPNSNKQILWTSPRMTAPGAERLGDRSVVAIILERKFHFLTIGNLCAVFSAMEIWEGFQCGREALTAVAQLPDTKA